MALTKVPNSLLILGSPVLQNVVEDTSPQLGGNLDVNGQTITSGLNSGDIAVTAANGSSAEGGQITLTGGDGNGFGNFGGSITISAGDSLSAAGGGGNVTINAGLAQYAGYYGGNVTIRGAQPLALYSSHGGDANVYGGGASIAGYNAGDVNIYAGGGAAGGTPGTVTIKGGVVSGANTNNGGSVLIAGTDGAGNGSNGGSTTINSGDGGTVGNAGNIILSAGVGGSVSGDGGSVSLLSGQSNSSGSPIGDCGSIVIIGASTGVVGSFPGDVFFYGGSSTGSNNVAGGGAVITGGHGSVSGAGSSGGQLYMASGNARAGDNIGGQLSFVGGNGFGSGKGGKLVFTGGPGGATGGGGHIEITAGAGGSTSGNGGNISMTPGAGGAGSPNVLGAINAISADSATGGSIHILEGQGNGWNYISLKSPDSITTNREWVLPETAPVGSNVLVTDDSGNLSFAKYARKNMIYNGCMRVWQRGTAFTGVTSNDFTADRWRYVASTTGVIDVDRVIAAATLRPFATYFQVDVTTADTSIAAGDYAGLVQKLEGLDAEHLRFSLSNASDITLSFWHAHSQTGTFCVAIRNSDNTRSYVAEYTQDVASTFQRTTITIPGDTAGTWANMGTTSAALSVHFTLAAGSTYQTTADAWTTGNYLGTSSQTNALSSTANFFRFSNVQLEEGSEVTDFDRRTYGEELALCQRYFVILEGQSTGAGSMQASTTAQTFHPIPTSMRATPSISATASGHRVRTNGSNLTPSAVSVIGLMPSAVMLSWTVTGGTQYHACGVRSNGANIELTAEL